MARLNLTRCQCGYKKVERLTTHIPTTARAKLETHWDDYEKLGHLKEHGFDKELLDLFHSTEFFTVREKVFYWVTANVSRTKPLEKSKDRFWYLRKIVCSMLIILRLGQIPYVRRVRCPQCKQIALKWYPIE